MQVVELCFQELHNCKAVQFADAGDSILIEDSDIGAIVSLLPGSHTL